jgi:hypothetical protein
MEGVLRLKQQGADGLFCWRRRRFVLDGAELSISPAVSVGRLGEEAGDSDVEEEGGDLDGVKVTLKGARCARAYSSLASLNGCGFDIFWASGKVWSLLAEDATVCNDWVSAINSAIDEKAPGGPPPATELVPSDSSTVMTRSSLHSTMMSGVTDGSASTPSVNRTMRSTSLFTPQPPIVEVDADEDAAEETGTNIRDANAPSEEEGGGGDEDVSPIKPYRSEALPLPPAHPPSHQGDEVATLRQRCARLEAALTTAESNCFEIEATANQMRREGGRRLEAGVRRVLEENALEVSRIQANHESELNRLRTSWDDERQRTRDIVVSLRGRIESLEAMLHKAQQRADAAEGGLSAARRELQEFELRHRKKVDLLEASRSSQQAELDAMAAAGAKGTSELAASMRHKHAQEIAALATKMELELAGARQQAAREAEAQASAALEKKIASLSATHAAELEAVKQRAETRRNDKDSAAAAERDRMHQDVERLRELHAVRVKELESFLGEERMALQASRREVAELQAARYADSSEAARWREEQEDAAKAHLAELRGIRTELIVAEQNVEAARVREAEARGELRRVLEARRLEKAEDLETRRQAEEMFVDVKQAELGKKCSERELRRTRQELAICQQELALGERERQRHLREREEMATSIARLSKLVYGGTSLASQMLSPHDRIAKDKENPQSPLSAKPKSSPNQTTKRGRGRLGVSGIGSNRRMCAYCSPDRS